MRMYFSTKRFLRMETFCIFATNNNYMGRYKIKVVLLDEALAFVRSLPIKVQEKIVYNYNKIERGMMSKELFKKLENSEIWEFRHYMRAIAIGSFPFGTRTPRLL